MAPNKTHIDIIKGVPKPIDFLNHRRSKILFRGKYKDEINFGCIEKLALKHAVGGNARLVQPKVITVQ